MKKTVALLVALNLLFFRYAPPAEAGVCKKMTGKAVKTAARLTVFFVNMDKLKGKLERKIKTADEDKFRAKYKRIYEAVKDMPQEIKKEYYITPLMTKERMIDNIRKITKKDVYGLIRTIPDETVADLLTIYKSEIKTIDNDS